MHIVSSHISPIGNHASSRPDPTSPRVSGFPRRIVHDSIVQGREKRSPNNGPAEVVVVLRGQ